MAQFRARAAADHQGQSAEQGSDRRHHDRAKAQQGRLVDRLARRFSFVAFGLERKVDHHDRVLLDDADEQNDADDRDDTEIIARDDQRQQRANARRRQCRKNRYRVDEALIENAEHDIDGHDGCHDEQEFIEERRLEGERRALELRRDAGGKSGVALRLLDRVDSAAERIARGDVERDHCRRKLAQMIDLKRHRSRLDARKGGQRHLPASGRRQADSRITRYWLDWVKIVEMMRWPSASYSALSIVAEVMPKRAAVSRSTTTVAESPRSMKLVETFCKAGAAESLAISFGTHSVNVAE